MKLLSHSIFVGIIAGALLCSGAVAESSDAQWTEPTPGAPNAIIFDESTSENNAVTTLIISEVLPSPENHEEFIELLNYGSEQISLEGWHLQDATGSFVLEGFIEPGAYLAVYPSFALNNDGDSIALYAGDVLVDEFNYSKEQVEKGSSISRFCDVYELGWCVEELTQSTPAAPNVHISIEAWATPTSGEYVVGTEVSLHTNIDGATLWYTFDPETPANEMLRYETPFVLDGFLSLYISAQYEDRMTAPLRLQYTVPQVSVPRYVHDVYLNEVYFGDHMADRWVEIKNFSGSRKPLFEWYLSPCEQLTICRDESVELSSFKRLYPSQKVVVSLSGHESLLHSDDLYLLDSSGRIADELHLPKETGDFKSFIRLATPKKKLAYFRNTREGLVPSNYALTYIPTPAEENIVLTDVEDDEDSDYLSSEEEIMIGTDASQYDSNDNSIPDFFDRGVMYETEGQWNIADFLHRKLMTEMMSFELATRDDNIIPKIIGRVMPRSTLSIYRATGTHPELLTTTTSDEKGLVSFTIPTFDGELVDTLMFRIVDRLGKESFFSKPFIFDTQGIDIAGYLSKGELRITALLANPEGKDSYDQEWVEVTNESGRSLNLGEFSILVNNKEALFSETFEVAETKKLHFDTANIHLTNTGGELVLLYLGEEIDHFTYPEPSEGEVIYRTEPFPIEGIESENISAALRGEDIGMKAIVLEDVIEPTLRSNVSDIEAVEAPMPPSQSIMIYFFALSSVLSGLAALKV